METQIEIHTNRLLLKSITPQIINHLLNTKSATEVKAYFNINEEAYIQLKHMAEKGMETHRISVFYFLLVEKESNHVLGECGFHTWNNTHRRAELFYSLKNDIDKRKGYMGEALQHVLNHGFNALHLHRVEALIAEENIASKKLVEKYKFTREGIMREDYCINGKNEDSVCFSLLKPEWEAQLKTL
ncbi:MAG: GNAT family protein [Bacteroidota bacterium]|nr:GNAT family protein [Bacteroidota bacterium]